MMSLCKCVTKEFIIERKDQFFPKPPYPGKRFPGSIAGKWVANCSHFGFSDTAFVKSQQSPHRNLRNPHTTPILAFSHS